ncbi:hypothetical protein DEO72_LG4g966 [Vigna unguiculata]|uniref:Uncharacterized protein n=1 Tax=Vigna unguiculata TaxID=3917 RepID=A0A4D6LPR1_VIGUN|nr:hypothetical protein DEO72_LG4g966 [Vigna unguiculata]
MKGVASEAGSPATQVDAGNVGVIRGDSFSLSHADSSTLATLTTGVVASANLFSLLLPRFSSSQTPSRPFLHRRRINAAPPAIPLEI